MAARQQKAVNQLIRWRLYAASAWEEESFARKGFEFFHGLPEGLSDAGTVRHSSAGVEGWANFWRQMLPTAAQQQVSEALGSLDLLASCVQSRFASMKPRSFVVKGLVCKYVQSRFASMKPRSFVAKGLVCKCLSV